MTAAAWTTCLLALLWFTALLGWLAKREDRQIEAAPWEAKLRHDLKRLLRGYRALASLFDALNRAFEIAIEWAFTIAFGLVGLAAILASLLFFGYGAWRGAVMFFTLEPVSILAGLVLFLVSVFVGYWVIIACFSLTLWACGKVGHERASSQARHDAAKEKSRPTIEAA